MKRAANTRIRKYKYKRCKHCNEDVSKTTYYRHKSLYKECFQDSSDDEDGGGGGDNAGDGSHSSMSISVQPGDLCGTDSLSPDNSNVFDTSTVTILYVQTKYSIMLIINM